MHVYCNQHLSVVMAKQSVEATIDGLKKLQSETEGLEEVAQEKIKQLTDELGVTRPPFPPPHDHDQFVVDVIRSGFLKFRTSEFEANPEKYEKLAEEQRPKFLVFSCSDSRVSALNILSFTPGEAFMARSIANLVPQFLDKERNQGTGAIIEYAVTALHVEHILLIGHSRCGGIRRLMSIGDHEEHPDFIDDWVKIATKAKEEVLATGRDLLFDEKMQEMRKEYPYVKEGLHKKTLQLWGGYYDFVDGTFQLWNIDNPHQHFFPGKPITSASN
ncbi:hypothetical protein Droror1_Dr00021277 [Drosera rotundifolia]